MTTGTIAERADYYSPPTLNEQVLEQDFATQGVVSPTEVVTSWDIIYLGAQPLNVRGMAKLNC